MVLSFMIRCTSPIGWIPLILYKIIKEGSFCAFFLSGLIVALPTLIALVAIDSIYYEQLTFVAYNFLYKNLVENVSASFGVSPPTEYLYKTLPWALNFIGIITIAAICNNINECRSKREFPHFLVLVFTYTLAFSMIPHKEDRFVVPIIPYLLILAGDFTYKQMKKYGRIVAILMLIAVSYEVVIQTAYYLCENKHYRPLTDIMRTDPNPH